MKTYKLYIGGKFPRTESGRYYTPKGKGNVPLGNICLSSRKDFRNAVVAARKAQGAWGARSAFNRSQILYRMAEVVEGRKSQFIEELVLQGSTAKQAEAEVRKSIDRLVHYAGWCDKYQQVFSSVNPVASSHFNFSMYEPTGVVTAFAPENTALLGLVSVMAPIIAGGNSCIIVASESKPLCSITLSEALHTSDLPSGVVNVLTGKHSEIASHAAKHMDVNAFVWCGAAGEEFKNIEVDATENLKRVKHYNDVNWGAEEGQGPYFILDTQEVKTTWHPIERIAGTGSGY